MARILECVDYSGRRVVLTDDRWYDHILMEHPELIQNDRSIEETLVSPHAVTQDTGYANREVFYRLGALPPPDKQDLLKVVVQFEETIGDQWVGRVITAYAITAVEPRETRIWTAPSAPNI